MTISLTAHAADTTTTTPKPADKKAIKPPPPGQECGIFEITGYIKKAGNNSMIVLAPGSRSETQIILASDATKDPKHPTILPAENSFITAKVQINQPVAHYRGSAQKISDITLAVPNEMRADKGTSLKLIEPKPCIFQGM